MNYVDQSAFAVGELKPAIKMSQPLINPIQNDNSMIAPSFTKFAQNYYENDGNSQIPLEFQHAVSLSSNNEFRNQPNFG